MSLCLEIENTELLKIVSVVGKLPSQSFTCLLDVLRNPLESIAIAHLADNAAHKHLQWANIGICQIDLPLTSCEVGQAHMIAQLILRSGIGYVNLVPQNKKRDSGQ